ncbi:MULTISPECIES: NPCBM/NEW2 domain-containing protein [unclassified Saccharothrix]|uniref:NPCBM/NEW2 domain-containing protein n=1 Tax=unclassified Saccharothrix TaxID=2593673 RepID=UPI00307F0972
MPEPTPVASSVESLSTPRTTATTTTTYDPEPGTTWLSDREPTAGTTPDTENDRGPWTSGRANVRGNMREKAWRVSGAWCGKAQLAFTLDRQFTRLTAQVAIAGDSPDTRPLDFYVMTDGTRSVEFQHVGKAPQPVDIALTGVQSLAIGVEPPDGDATRCPGPERVAVWVEARLIPLR